MCIRCFALIGTVVGIDEEEAGCIDEEGWGIDEKEEGRLGWGESRFKKLMVANLCSHVRNQNGLWEKDYISKSGLLKNNGFGLNLENYDVLSEYHKYVFFLLTW